MREIDYINTAMNQIKKDISFQGQQIEYSKIENYLSGKWKLWFFKIRLAIASAGYTVHVKLVC